MHRYLKSYAAAMVLLALTALPGCGPKVMVPPNVDLGVFESIALIDFTSNAEGNLADYATQKFLEIVTASQPEARLIEVGTEEEVLARVGAERIDLEAVKAIAGEYGVDGVISGHLEVSDVKPHVNISTDLGSLGVKADIEASLTARLYDTYDGATLWTSSARGSETVANVDVLTGGGFYFDADDPGKAYGALVDGLIEDVTYDLRVRWERQ